MKHMKKKTLLLAVSIVLILTAAIGGTVAYLVAKTDTVTNTFEYARVPITVRETFDGASKTDVKIHNEGNIPAYIRAKVVVTWKDATGNVRATKPSGTNYDLKINQSDWTEQDGFYYCNKAVAAGQDTPVLIESCTMLGDAPEGYTLSVEIIAESIQAEPAKAVTSAWGVTPSGN